VSRIHLAYDRDQRRVLLNSNELSGSVKYWGIFEWLSDWRLLKKDSAAWN
jgi:hypothetical protein